MEDWGWGMGSEARGREGRCNYVLEPWMKGKKSVHWQCLATFGQLLE